jgi:hypothetical protein
MLLLVRKSGKSGGLRRTRGFLKCSHIVIVVTVVVAGSVVMWLVLSLRTCGEVFRILYDVGCVLRSFRVVASSRGEAVCRLE